MANTNNPTGFTLIPTGAGAPSTHMYSVDASNSNAIGVGDIVDPEADGKVGRHSAGGTQSLGCVVGVFDATGQKGLSYLPASTAGKVLVVPVDGQRFSVQIDDVVAETDVFAIFNAIVANPDTISGRSKTQIDGSTKATANATFRLIGLDGTVEDNEWGQYAKVIVEFNKDLNSAGTATV